MSVIPLVVKMVHPYTLFYGVLLFGLGSGIARYSGETIDWNSYLWGQIWVTTLQLSAHLFGHYYDAVYSKLSVDKIEKKIFKVPGIADHQVLFYGGLVALCALIPVTMRLYLLEQGGLATYIVLISLILMVYVYLVPPLRLAESGYGEIVQSIGLVFMVPLLSFLLHSDQNPRLVLLVAFPLVLAHLVMQLVFELKQYAMDLRIGKRNFMVQVGWQNGMMVLILTIVACFVTILVNYSLGLPRFILTTGLVLLPVGLALIWLVIRIANGFKPNWKLLTFTVSGFLGLMSYLFAFGFWTG
jgi:1,4-dihydroxy-2-naphthoate octaprenyltransferase